MILRGRLAVAQLFLVTLVTSSNLESSGGGSFCIARPPKSGVAANCSSTSTCEYLLNVSPPSSSSSSAILSCGEYGECVTNLKPNNEHCKSACDSSSCASLCLQLYETKVAQYCIETRDHPNAMPPQQQQFPNKYYCTCLLPSNDNSFHHKVVGRHLNTFY